MRNLEIIGGAAKHIPNEVRSQHPEIDWRRLAAFRDVAIHRGGCPGHARGIRSSTCPRFQAAGRWPSEARSLDEYFGIDVDGVWDIIQNKIPALDPQIRRLLSE